MAGPRSFPGRGPAEALWRSLPGLHGPGIVGDPQRSGGSAFRSGCPPDTTRSLSCGGCESLCRAPRPWLATALLDQNDLSETRRPVSGRLIVVMEPGVEVGGAGRRERPARPTRDHPRWSRLRRGPGQGAKEVSAPNAGCSSLILSRLSSHKPVERKSTVFEFEVNNYLSVSRLSLRFASNLLNLRGLRRVRIS